MCSIGTSTSQGDTVPDFTLTGFFLGTLDLITGSSSDCALTLHCVDLEAHNEMHAIVARLHVRRGFLHYFDLHMNLLMIG